MSAATVPVPLLSKLPVMCGPLCAEEIELVAQISVVGQLQIERTRAGPRGMTCQTTLGGRFGRFAIDADGAWTYCLDRTLPQVQALGAGECLIDDCTVHDAAGHRHVIAVTMLGSAGGLPIRFVGDESCIPTEFDSPCEPAPPGPPGHDGARASLPGAPSDLHNAVERWWPDPCTPPPSLVGRADGS